LREAWGDGFPAGYPIHFNGEVIEQIGHVKDPRSGQLFPLHLTESCSPNFPNLFDDGEPPIKDDLPTAQEEADAWDAEEEEWEEWEEDDDDEGFDGQEDTNGEQEEEDQEI
jgi:hypothetical protein